MGRGKGAAPEPLMVSSFRSVVRYRLGPRLARGLGSIWNPRTQLPTLASLELLHRLGAARGLDVAEWLCSDAEETPLEACQADWRPVIR